MASATPTATDPGTTPSPVSATIDQPATTETEPVAPSNIVAEATAAADPFDAEKLTLPEGFDKGENFTTYIDIMKEFGVSQSKAQELLSLHAKAIEAASKSTMDAWQQQQADWQKEIKADTELGGSNFDTVKQTIAKVLDNAELTDPGFRQAMGFTGAGNHPAIVRTLFRWAKALSEGSSVTGSPPGRDRNGAVAGQQGGGLYGQDGPHTGGPRFN